jgi:hypothetical protein
MTMRGSPRDYWPEYFRREKQHEDRIYAIFRAAHVSRTVARRAAHSFASRPRTSEEMARLLIEASRRVGQLRAARERILRGDFE